MVSYSGALLPSSPPVQNLTDLTNSTMKMIHPPAAAPAPIPSGPSTSVPVIVGSVVGGVAGLAIIAIGGFLVYRRRCERFDGWTELHFKGPVNDLQHTLSIWNLVFVFFITFSAKCYNVLYCLECRYFNGRDSAKGDLKDSPVHFHEFICKEDHGSPGTSQSPVTPMKVKEPSTTAVGGLGPIM